LDELRALREIVIIVERCACCHWFIS
jgi:hypothetical protein